MIPVALSTLNLDLLSVGVAIAGIGMLGFIVYLNDRRNVTNLSFLLFAGLTMVWGVSNYLNYQFLDPEVVLWVLRTHLFISVWHAYFFFQLAYVFPRDRAGFSRSYKWILLPLVAVTAVLTLTPLVFKGIGTVAAAGQVTNPERGPAIALFALMAIYLVGAGVFLLFRKFFRAQGAERRQYGIVAAGTAITFILIITFNLVLPVFFNKLAFAPLGAVFILPFIAFTAYAIFKHHFLNVKVIATEIVAFLLTMTTLLEVVYSQGWEAILFRSGLFLLALFLSFLLIRSVRREVEQREELERLDEQLEDKNRQLDQLSHFKSELLSLASHQMRSPLAAMKGFLSLIIQGAYGEVSDKAKEAIGKAERSADELIGLINTLLDMRKVDEGKMEYQFAKVDLNKLGGDVVSLLRPLAEGKKLEFTYDSPGHEVWVSADAEKLKQVVQNLTDNAIKYTPNGFVKVVLKEEGGNAVVTVSDSGLGIALALVPHLFEEFIRDERVKKEIRGTGLGLYIARKIAEAHKGRVWAESAGEGKGSAFSLSVPLMK